MLDLGSSPPGSVEARYIGTQAHGTFLCRTQFSVYSSRSVNFSVEVTSFSIFFFIFSTKTLSTAKTAINSICLFGFSWLFLLVLF